MGRRRPTGVVGVGVVGVAAGLLLLLLLFFFSRDELREDVGEGVGETGQLAGCDERSRLLNVVAQAEENKGFKLKALLLL